MFTFVEQRLPEGFAEGTLLARLQDDSPSVVETVLKIGVVGQV